MKRQTDPHVRFPAFIRPPASQHRTTEVLGELAQLGERLVCNQEVTGSSPVFSTLTAEAIEASRARLGP